MDLTHKHWAVIAIGVLVAIFAAVLAWHLFGSQKAIAPGPDTATTTPNDSKSDDTETIGRITEHAPYYNIDLTYPSVTPLTSVSVAANNQAVASMRAEMQSIAAEFKKNGNFPNLTAEDVQMMGMGERKQELGSEYEVHTGSRTISYEFLIYEDTLGAHPNGYYRTFTFDTETGKALTLSDIFSASNYIHILSERSRQDLPAAIRKISGTDGDPDYIRMGTEPQPENFQNWYIRGSNFVLVFSPYQVGPYALGTITLPIPLSQLSASLSSEYK